MPSGCWAYRLSPWRRTVPDASTRGGEGVPGHDELCHHLCFCLGRGSLLGPGLVESGHRLQADVGATDEPFVVGLAGEHRHQADQRGVAGEMSTTSVRRTISRLKRFGGLVEPILGQCTEGTKARTSTSASSSSAATF